jgi:hypothetical protein
MASYKGEYWTKGVDEKVRPDIVVQIKMKDKKHRQKWTEEEKLNAKVWMIKERDRLNSFITDL